MTEKWIRWAAAAAIALIAIYLRADSLGEPVLWYDEAISALRSTGHTERDVVAFANARGAVPISELQRFLQPDPSRGLADTLHSLSIEDAQHTPAYYVIAHYWAKWIGGDAGSTRIPAVIFSLLTLPAFYWLCLELFVYSGVFQSTLVCWIGATVVALSPYQVGFAREHREYSLWMLTLVVMSWTFFRALRLGTRAAWGLFSLALALAAYTHLLTWLVWAALAVTLLVRERSLIRRPVLAFALASLGAGILFLPWALVVLENRAAIQGDLEWVSTLARPTRFHVYSALFPHFRIGDLAFFDLMTPYEGAPGHQLIRYVSTALPIGLLCGALLYARRLRADVAAFLALLLLVITATTFAADFMTGGVLGFVTRYAAPTIFGWQLAITFLFACFLRGDDRWKSFRVAAVAVALCASAYAAYSEHAGAFSFVKRPSDGGFVAEYLNFSNSSVVSDDYVGALLSLSTQCRPDLPVLARPRCPSCPDTRRIVEIPEAGTATKMVFYRSWMNIGHETIRQPLQDALGNDRFGDPRYHTKAVEGVNASIFLYELTRR